MIIKKGSACDQRPLQEATYHGRNVTEASYTLFVYVLVYSFYGLPSP